MTVQPCTHHDLPTYRRHQPEKTLLYKLMSNNLETWLEQRRTESGAPLPDFVEHALRSFLDCGILERGFILVTCDKCDHSLPVAHSCKDRSFCPSCAAKRSAETTTHLIDNILPDVPYRQYVVTFPYELRFLLATSRELTNRVHRIAVNMIAAYYQQMAEERGVKDSVHGGFSFIQRFGSALNLNPHLHLVFADGVWARREGSVDFYSLPGPDNEHVQDIIEAVAHAIIDMLRGLGLLPGEAEEVDRPDLVDPLFADSDQMAAVAYASQHMRIAFGENAGRKVRRIGRGFGYEEEISLIKGKRLASVNGFTCHANRFIGAGERKKLENLISYGARGPFSHKRLSLKDPTSPDGDLVYELKSAWHDGTRAILLSQMEIIEKLAALVPPKYLHTSRQFGVFAPNSSMRRDVVLKPHVRKGFVASADGSTVERLSWSILLKRTFRLDVERCMSCQAPIRPENCVLFDDPKSIRKVMKVLAIEYHPPPVRQARCKQGELFYEAV